MDATVDDTTALHWPDAIYAQFRRVGIRQSAMCRTPVTAG